MGLAAATASCGSAAATVNGLYGDSPPAWVKSTVRFVPFTVVDVHGWTPPATPAKHTCPINAAGATTRTVAASIGTDHSVPIAFQ
jgi:hypothetical protein